MIHSIGTLYLPQYKYAGTNQHGTRYKAIDSKKVRVATLSIVRNSNENQMWEFMALCSSLDVPPDWRTEDSEQRMSIEIVAKKLIV